MVAAVHEKVADFRNLTPCTNSKYSKNTSSMLATQTISIDAMASHVSDTDFYLDRHPI